MPDPGSNTKEQDVRPAFRSKLEKGQDRFLAHAIEHALEVGRRSAQDFIRHFPPETIMQGLSHQPRLRAGILVLTTGLKQRIAMRKSWQSSAEDLQIALDEHETDAESVVSVFQPDDRVRYLDAKKIWQFLIEGSFWNVGISDQEKHRLAKEHVAFMLERALADRLLTHRDIVEGITVAEMARRLPKSELGKIIEGALAKARDSAPFTEVDLLAAMPAFVLVEHIPLPHIWQNVVEEKIAQAHGYVEPPGEQTGRDAQEKQREPEQADRGPSGAEKPAKPAKPAPSVAGKTEKAKDEPEPMPISSGAPPRDSDWVELASDRGSFDDEVSDDDFIT